ncbi:MAG: hypothetical protein IPJ20_16945 [Flammeovirgaceae bacterium]|nr:hypothetical protein [Flammeovirgaceae bacterium]
MSNQEALFNRIDDLIKAVNQFKNEDDFTTEFTNRKNKNVIEFKDSSEELRNLANLIVYSQNSNSKLVEQVIASGNLDTAFANFDMDKVTELNPCDIADNHWNAIKGIRQQAKLFHIVSLARKIKSLGSLSNVINQVGIPNQVMSQSDIEEFWVAFNRLQKEMKRSKIPFFQSTTSLLHLLMDWGYDCVKPDLVVLNISKQLEIIESTKGEQNFRRTVRVVQEYSVDRKIRPSVIDFYFLIAGGQMAAKKFVIPEFYQNYQLAKF